MYKVIQTCRIGSLLQDLISHTDTTVYNLVPYDCQIAYSDTMIVEEFTRSYFTVVKAIVNGATYFEDESFEIDVNNHFIWKDPEYELKEDDTIYLEWLVNAATQPVLVLPAEDGLLYLVIENKLIVITKDGVDYPVCVEISAAGTYAFYVRVSGEKQYYKIFEDGSVKEVDASEINDNTFLTEDLL